MTVTCLSHAPPPQLSKLKMSPYEIRALVMGMDREECLSKDMVEQMLKYVPTAAEVDLLESQGVDEEVFARADRFLLEMSRYVGGGARACQLSGALTHCG